MKKNKERIFSEVEKKHMLQKAKEADKSVIKNKITMDEIVAESRKARKKIAKKYR